MKKSVATLCAAMMYFGLAAIMQAEKPGPPGSGEIIPGEYDSDVFIASSDKPIDGLVGLEAPLPAGLNPSTLQRLKPPLLRAAYQKKKVKPSEIKPETAMALYASSPPPPSSGSVSAAAGSDNGDKSGMKGEQAPQALSPSENKIKRFTYYPESSLTIYSGSSGALHDVVSYLGRNPTARVHIRAYADSSGDITRALDLSRKRVLDIRNYLILHDISGEIITAEVLEASTVPESDQTKGASPLTDRVELTVR